MDRRPLSKSEFLRPKWVALLINYKVEYALTPFCESLTPVLTSIAEWGKIVAEEKGEIIE
ncbi:MAG TPA: winged helix-turn-helix transcriptional regulator [Gillisia sp.]|nr:winged helix-turn-helix transcriptional regulator [Gillisia sp.]